MHHPENDGSFVPTSDSETVLLEVQKIITRANRIARLQSFILKTLIYSGYCPSPGVITPEITYHKIVDENIK